jgi:hypothetical protein
MHTSDMTPIAMKSDFQISPSLVIESQLGSSPHDWEMDASKGSLREERGEVLVSWVLKVCGVRGSVC